MQQDRKVQVSENIFRLSAKQKVSKPGLRVGSHYQQIATCFVSLLNQELSRMTTAELNMMDFEGNGLPLQCQEQILQPCIVLGMSCLEQHVHLFSSQQKLQSLIDRRIELNASLPGNCGTGANRGGWFHRNHDDRAGALFQHRLDHCCRSDLLMSIRGAGHNQGCFASCQTHDLGYVTFDFFKNRIAMGVFALRTLEDPVKFS